MIITAESPLGWIHLVTDVGASGLRRKREATVGERQALSATLDLTSCESLAVEYVVRALGQGRYVLEGELTAHVTQVCVATLQPVRSRIAETFRIELWPDTPENFPIRGESESPVLDAPDVEPLTDGRIPVGRLMTELLASALDPYPRAEGAEFRWQDPKAGDAGPFAALSALKGKGDT